MMNLSPEPLKMLCMIYELQDRLNQTKQNKLNHTGGEETFPDSHLPEPVRLLLMCGNDVLRLGHPARKHVYMLQEKILQNSVK